MTRCSSRTSGVRVALVAGLLLHAPHAAALDGFSVAPSEPETETYFEAQTEAGAESLEAGPEDGMPTALHVSESTATLSYRPLDGGGADRQTWEVRLEGLSRRHEKVDAVYQMILLLPLPVGPDGRDDFKSQQWGITAEEGAPGASVPLVYGGEKVVLKRNRGLERVLLPRWIGPGADQIPSLEGTGYAYTLWDSIIRYDPGRGNTISAGGALRYETASAVPAPDASDEALKGYLITWIPSLDPVIPPFAIRVDVAPR